MLSTDLVTRAKSLDPHLLCVAGPSHNFGLNLLRLLRLDSFSSRLGAFSLSTVNAHNSAKARTTYFSDNALNITALSANPAARIIRP